MENGYVKTMTNQEKIDLIAKKIKDNEYDFTSIELDEESPNRVKIKIYKEDSKEFERNVLKMMLNYIRDMYKGYQVSAKFVQVEEYPWYDNFDIYGINPSKFIMEFECVKNDTKVAIYPKKSYYGI